MGVTTYEAIRDAMITAVVGKVPTSQTDVRFRASVAQRDLEEEAETNPNSCFRLFAIGPQRDREDFQTSNLDVREENVTSTIRVCYPNDYRYGPDNRRDAHDIIDEDSRAIQQVIGPEGGFRSFADATIRFESDDTADLGSFFVYSLTLRVLYFRSMP